MGFAKISSNFVWLILQIAWGLTRKFWIFGEKRKCFRLNGDKFEKWRCNFTNITDNEEWIGKREFLGKVKAMEKDGIDTKAKMEFDFGKKVLIKIKDLKNFFKIFRQFWILLISCLLYAIRIFTIFVLSIFRTFKIWFCKSIFL